MQPMGEQTQNINVFNTCKSPPVTVQMLEVILMVKGTIAISLIIDHNLVTV